MTAIKQRHAGYHDTPCDCRLHVLDCFDGSCEGCAQPAPAPDDAAALAAALTDFGLFGTSDDEQGHAMRASRYVLAALADRAAALPAHPPAPPKPVGIVQRAHVACCWCGEHHEEGR